MWVESFNYDDKGCWREYPVVGGDFFRNVATAGALMAAEDHGYRSGYKTGLDHGKMTEAKQREERLWRATHDSLFRGEQQDSLKNGGWGGF